MDNPETVECPKCGFQSPKALGTLVSENENAKPPIPARMQHKCLGCLTVFYVVVEST